jgi:hypothetical protein
MTMTAAVEAFRRAIEALPEKERARVRQLQRTHLRRLARRPGPEEGRQEDARRLAEALGPVVRAWREQLAALDVRRS